MKKLLLLLVTALAPVALFGQCSNNDLGSGYHCIQSVNVYNGSLDIGTCRMVLPRSTTAGNLIVVGIALGGVVADRQARVTDSQGNVYSPATQQVNWHNTGGGSSAQIFYAPNIRGGADTVTMTEVAGTNAFNGCVAHEYSGVAATSPLDVTATGTGTTGSSPFPISSGSATTTADRELIFGFGVTLNGNLSAGPGFTMREPGGSTEDRVQATRGPITGTELNSLGGDPFYMAIATFRPGGPPPTVVTAVAGTGSTAVTCVLSNAQAPTIHIVCSVGSTVESTEDAIPVVGGGITGASGGYSANSNTVTWTIQQPMAGILTWQTVANGVGRSGTF